MPKVATSQQDYNTIARLKDHIREANIEGLITQWHCFKSSGKHQHGYVQSSLCRTVNSGRNSD